MSAGEGSSILMLDEEHARKRGGRIYCERAGYALRKRAARSCERGHAGEGDFLREQPLDLRRAEGFRHMAIETCRQGLLQVSWLRIAAQRDEFHTGCHARA